MDAMARGELRPLARFMHSHQSLSPRLVLFLGLLIRDPAGVESQKLHVVAKTPSRGKPRKLSEFDEEVKAIEVAIHVAMHEHAGHGGHKAGVAKAEVKFKLSRAAVERCLANGRLEWARKRVAAWGTAKESHKTPNM